MKKIVWIIVFFFIVLPVISVCQTASLTIINDRLCVTAENTPLQDLLKQAAMAGIKIRIDPGINPLISKEFTGKEIQDGFDEILAGLNHSYIWAKNLNGDPRLSEIVVFRPGKTESVQTLRASKNLDIAQDPKTGAYYVKNRILLTFNRQVSTRKVNKLIEDLNAGITSVNTYLGIYALILQGDADLNEILARLKQEGIAGMAEPDYAYRAGGTPRVTGLSESADAQAQSDMGSTPSSFAVAVLDTGLMETYASQGYIQGSFDALDPECSISDNLGHGTQMALIASGQVSPVGVNPDEFSNPVLSVRAFDDNGFTSNSTLMTSIEYALENDAKVLSMSWGSETDSAFLETAVNYAASKGLVVVAAAGNSPTGDPVYPAAYESVIAVSALGPDGKTWEMSNYGDFVDLAAPGFASLPVGYNGDPGTYAGTSISTAYLAGKIADYLRKHPGTKTIDAAELMNSD
ncbi:S8 family serine peptidase [uncultured Desulfobacter sp.]|uniref:S8 family peptidase n=1 Tax=uncultured Desulfobacter sp. TaxID=240139 RepID=UPI002AA8312A|nr:S8 family serine peptidase [uncultured Desulfobacter sp.]